MPADPKPRDGNVYKRVAGPRTGAGYVTLSVGPVHLHECPYWRMGQKHGPCRCGACDLMDQLVTEHGTVKPCEACGIDVAYLDLGVFGYLPQTHRSPQGYQCRGPVEGPALLTPDDIPLTPPVEVTAEDVFEAMSQAYRQMEGNPIEATDVDFERRVAQVLTERLAARQEGEG